MKSSGFTARKSIVVWTLLSPGFLSLGVSFSFGGLVEGMLLSVEYYPRSRMKYRSNFCKKTGRAAFTGYKFTLSLSYSINFSWCKYYWLPPLSPNIPSLCTMIFNLVNFVHPKISLRRFTSSYSKSQSPDNGLRVFHLPLANALATCRPNSNSLQTTG